MKTETLRSALRKASVSLPSLAAVSNIFGKQEANMITDVVLQLLFELIVRVLN